MSSPSRTGRSLLKGAIVVIVSVLVLVVIALVGWLAVTKWSDDEKIKVTAIFADASPLIAGNKVQLDGLEVGKISAISLVSGKAHVEMQLDRKVLPLHIDATARVEPVSLLGERFVALTQGSPNALVLPEGGAIDHTSASVDLDQLLNTLDDPTSTALAATVTTFGEGYQDNGKNIAKGLEGLAPTFHSIDRVSTLLDENNEVLDHLIVQLQKNIDQFGPPVDSLVDAAHQTVGAVAANREALNASLVEFPSTLTSARQTLAQLGGAADNTAGVLHDVRPITGNLKQVSRELSDFSDSASPALDSLPDVLDRVNKLLDQARPLVDDLKPASEDLSSVSDSVQGLGHQLLKHKPGQASQLENLMSGAANWAMTTSGYDGMSHYFRAHFYVSPSSLGHLAAGGLPPLSKRGLFNQHPVDPRGGPGHPGVVPKFPVPPSLPPLTSDTATGKGNATDQRDPNNATGMTPAQEGNMFDSLLRGSK